MIHRAKMAARKNADLYQAIFDAHGLRYIRDDQAFRAIDPPPPYYSPMTLLSPIPDDVLRQLVAKQADNFGHMVGLKDSFCLIKEPIPGLTSLFEATWLWHPGASLAPGNWVRIDRSGALLAWETAWKAAGSATDQRMFPDALRDNPDIAFFAAIEDEEIIAGCIANRSADCVGVSNIFARNETANIYSQAAAAAASLAPGKPLVSYDRGVGLGHLHSAGFQPVGSLRVWVAAS
ncbi:MAG: hypothetical protein AAFQ09_09145 [Pseudomonadota bacterium]